MRSGKPAPGEPRLRAPAVRAEVDAVPADLGEHLEAHRMPAMAHRAGLGIDRSRWKWTSPLLFLARGREMKRYDERFNRNSSTAVYGKHRRQEGCAGARLQEAEPKN